MTTDPQSAGFSLVELLVAMLVTMIITGAVFGLLSAGQGAFRREPELTDRQQNIRLSMDLVQRDLATAGLSVGAVSQVFRLAQNGVIALPAGPSGRLLDALEMVGSDGQCPDVPVGASTATTVSGAFNLPACFGTVGAAAPYAITQADGTTITWGFARQTNATTLDFAIPQHPLSTYAGVVAPLTLTRLQLVRYEVANDLTVPLVPVPSLWRSATGGVNPLAANGPLVPPGIGAAAVVAGWQMVARGIEDFQVRYRQVGVAALADVPPAEPLIGGTCNLQVQEVEITIWARALGANLQGQRNDGGLAPAVRGALTSLTTPRVVLLNNRAPAPAPCTWE